MEVITRFILVFLAGCILTACATPIAPTGGELDRTGPQILSTMPEDATVNYRERFVRFTFKDYVDRNSFRNAFRMEPDLNIRYEISWRRKTATVSFLEPLPENTTVIFRLGTELRDTRGNALSGPLTIALSTGSEIDNGEISMRIRPFNPKMRPENITILLYTVPADLEKPARYAAQPDTGGKVSFRYLSEGNYSALLVNDVNRNRIWDAAREYGQAFPSEVYELVEGAPLDIGDVYYARTDTTFPVLEGVGVLTQNRLRLRFNKEIVYKPGNEIQVTNDSTGQTFQAVHLYNDNQNKGVSFFLTTENLSEEMDYSLNPAGLQDNFGNRARPAQEAFEGSSVPDTTQIRYLAHLTETGVRRNEPVILAYTGRVQGTSSLDSLKIYLNRSLAGDAVRVEARHNLIYIHPNPTWQEGGTYEIRAWNPETFRFVNVNTRFIRDQDFGGINISISDSMYVGKPMRLFIYDAKRELRKNVLFTDGVTVDGLSEGSYYLVVFHDPEETGVWDTGRISPYRKPASIYVREQFPVRSRMTSELEVLFD